jgi:hypothetical protein
VLVRRTGCARPGARKVGLGSGLLHQSDRTLP